MEKRGKTRILEEFMFYFLGEIVKRMQFCIRRK